MWTRRTVPRRSVVSYPAPDADRSSRPSFHRTDCITMSSFVDSNSSDGGDGNGGVFGGGATDSFPYVSNGDGNSTTGDIVTDANDDAESQRAMTSLLNRYRVVINVYVVAVVCAFGIGGNLLSVVVLGRDRSIRRTTGFLLQALAVSDTVYLVTCLLYQTTKTMHDLTDWGDPSARRLWPYVEPFAWPLASIAQTCTVWLVVVVTADRYVAICRPLHAPQYSTVSRARVAVTVCIAVAVIYNLPRFFERTTVLVNSTSIAPSSRQTTSPLPLIADKEPYNPAEKGSDAEVQPEAAAVLDGYPVVVRNKLHDHWVYIVVYRSLLFFIARFLVPFSALAFFNTRLIIAVRQSTRLPGRHRGSCAGPLYATRSIGPATPQPQNQLFGQSVTQHQLRTFQQNHRVPNSSSALVTSQQQLLQQSTSTTSHKERYTVTLIVVVIVFVACELPDLLLRTWLALHSCLPSLPFPRDTLQFVNGASNLCLTLNSSINFLIYCFVGQRFRVVLIRMFCSPMSRYRRSSREGSMTTVMASRLGTGHVSNRVNGALRELGGGTRVLLRVGSAGRPAEFDGAPVDS